jgi:hypothetical protein
MSGRGRGRIQVRSGGRRSSGRGRSSSHSTNSSGRANQVKSSKKTLSDRIHYLGSAKQAADYETTTNFLINHIK